MSQLFDELKRRNVFRVSVAYVVTSWLVLQVADVVIGNIEAPAWVFSVFLLALTLGFFPIVFFSWAYELTPEGLKKEADVDRSSSITPHTGKKLDVITIIMLVAVVAFVFIERSMFSEPEETVATTVEPSGDTTDEIAVTGVDEQSIAVLAFEDLSQEGNQAFFAEGLSEEILNVLAQVPDLKVAGRTSSFAFKGKDTDLREIGEILNVAHILEGSVRKAGNRIRVTAQLIKASDGFHLFSETYDRDLDDIFAVQDEISALISNALRAELTGVEDVPHVTPTELAAYDHYLIARQRIRTRVPEMLEEALDLLDDALEIDPNYAPAIAQRALAVYLLSDSIGAYGEIPEAQAVPEAEKLLARALEIDPNLAEAYAVRGLIRIDNYGSNDEAVADLGKALEINPNLESAKLWLASVVPTMDEQIALYEDIVLRDPLYGPAFNNLIQQYVAISSFDNADALIDRVERVSGPDDSVSQARGTVAMMRGDLANGARALQITHDANPNSSINQLWRGYTLLFLGDLEEAAVSGRPEVAVLAYRELGDFAEAERIIESMDFRYGDQSRRLRHTADYLVARGKPQEVVELVEDLYGDAEGLIAALDTEGSWGGEYLPSVTYAYLLAGEEDEFKVLMGKYSHVMDFGANDGIDNWYHWYSRSMLEALNGNNDGAIVHLQRAYDDGYVSVFHFEPVFELLRDDARLAELEDKIFARANEERAKLGLDPYRPIAATN